MSSKGEKRKNGEALSESENDSPVKKSKTEKKNDSESSQEQDFMEKISSGRKKVCTSVADFKFNKKRVRVLSSAKDFPEDSKGVVYWMSRDQRVQGK